MKGDAVLLAAIVRLVAIATDKAGSRARSNSLASMHEGGADVLRLRLDLSQSTPHNDGANQINSVRLIVTSHLGVTYSSINPSLFALVIQSCHA